MFREDEYGALSGVNYTSHLQDKEELEKLTSLCDWLLHQGRDTIYQDTYEKLNFEIKQANGMYNFVFDNVNNFKLLSINVSVTNKSYIYLILRHVLH